MEEIELAVEKQKKGDLEGAREIYEEVLKGSPENVTALYLLGLVFDEMGDEEKSAECYGKIIELEPNGEKAFVSHYNLGVYFADKGDFEKAIEHYGNAIELNPNFADARWNRSLILLLLGRLEEGWKDYESRFEKESPTDSRNFGKPKWKGENLDGRKILIICEQGFGDCLQFIRYVKFVKDKKGYVILECKKELADLFRLIPLVDEVYEKKGPVPEIGFDCYVHLMDLPGIFGTEMENIPSDVPYLKADEGKVKKFEKFFDKSNFNVGIVWSGNPSQKENANRSAKLEFFERFSRIDGVKLFSLQKDFPTSENWVRDLSSELKDFSDTAAIIKNLDLVISVDTAVAHLAGALGKEVWTLLSFIPDWRWFLKGEKCPWYPGMKLFRQKSRGDWENVFEEVEKELKKKIE